MPEEELAELRRKAAAWDSYIADGGSLFYLRRARAAEGAAQLGGELPAPIVDDAPEGIDWSRTTRATVLYQESFATCRLAESVAGERGKRLRAKANARRLRRGEAWSQEVYGRGFYVTYGDPWKLFWAA